MKKHSLVLFLLLSFPLFAQSVKILSSDQEKIKIELNFSNSYELKQSVVEGKEFVYIEGAENVIRMPGEPYLPIYNLKLGISQSASPSLRILSVEEEQIGQYLVLPYPDFDNEGNALADLTFEKEIYGRDSFYPENLVELGKDFLYRFIRTQPILFNPYTYNPVTRELKFNRKIVFEVSYNNININAGRIVPVKDKQTEQFVAQELLNKDVSRNWISEKSDYSDSPNSDDYSWYNPSKTYYKIFIKTEDVYRVTYEKLVEIGINIPQDFNHNNILLYNYGEQVPLEFISKTDSIFKPGDYFQFVGYPPQPSEFTKLNIFNKENVYWLTLDGGEDPYRYNVKSGLPVNWNRTLKQTQETVRFEVDSLFERLGYAPNGERDFWYWGKVNGSKGIPQNRFEARFDGAFPNPSDDNKNITLRVNLHGITNLSCSEDHRAFFSITNQPLGQLTWDGQNAATFDTTFLNAAGGISIFPSGNFMQVYTNGSPCNLTGSDEFRVNWFEFDYWRFNRAPGGNHCFFTSPPNSNGINRYQVWQWNQIDFRVYVPSKGEMIIDPARWNDPSQTFLFVDTISQRHKYYCISNSYFKVPDRFELDQTSNLRNTSNGADYIVITHKDFFGAAVSLANFRKTNLEGYQTARTAVIDVQSIYDEFSYGLLDPYAITKFVKYAFEEWQTPVPAYLVLLGDMSYDYRKLLYDSRPNFIPSIPHHSTRYGLAVADNNFVTVAGDDYIPDMAIGRLSCETLEEANILVNKSIQYPADNGKEWKQRVLLIGAGQDEQDENNFGFNYQSILLQDFYIHPKGYTTSKVFRYPNKPEYLPFQGDSPQIREKFNEGVVMANFYGHGGGYQWDLVFTTDDVVALQNGGRQPIVSSVTCYTAHFDNQNVFGEVFNKLPDGGSIGFWGNTGLTFWTYGISINKKLFEKVFTDLNPTIGNALVNTKIDFASGGTNKLIDDNLALFTYLGDPGVTPAVPRKPDFLIKGSEISVSPRSPLVGDTVVIKSKIRNLGRVFTGDSVSVEMQVDYLDTSYVFSNFKFPSYGELDSIQVNWAPDRAGVVNLKISLNTDAAIDEDDFSDNNAVKTFSVFDLSQPNIVKPYDGMYTNLDKVEFVFADIGYYVDLNLLYFIEIDTTINFTSQIIQTEAIVPTDGIVKWQNSVPLSEDLYFWRTRLYDGEKYSDWTETRTFTITNNADEGYLAIHNQLKLFETFNFNYDNNEKKLILNTEILPPKPVAKRCIDTIGISVPYPNFLPTAITTDGKYLYMANKTYYNNIQPSAIYKIGTGFNGTVKGVQYDSIPNFRTQIWNSIFYHDGYIYVATGDAYNLVKVDPLTGISENLHIPSGMLDNSSGKVITGSQYIISDGEFVYNLAFKDSTGINRFLIRKFDPSNNWERVGDDLLTSSTSWGSAFSGFFVAENYIYPSESFSFGYMRRIRLSDGFFEEEWATNSLSQGYQGYHGWCYDKEHDLVYTSIARSGFTPQFRTFVGNYKEEEGYVRSPVIGPSTKWDYINYDLLTDGYTGNTFTYLKGLNRSTKQWDTLFVNPDQHFSLSSVSSDDYQYIRLYMEFSDSTGGITEPVKFSKLQVKYTSLPELIITNKDFSFTPDSLMQGFPIQMNFSTRNIGYAIADSVKLTFYLGNSETPLYQTYINVKPDSTVIASYIIDTSPLLFFNTVNVELEYPTDEYYSFNNLALDSFFVARDSLRPAFEVVFDGEEILNGDIISSKPEILMTLSDNSPLPIDTSYFFIYLDNEVKSFKNDTLQYTYTPYPNSKATIAWNPELPNGRHIMEVLAKDASGNYFDSTSFRISFFVNTENEILDVYNYPNPFTENTYFTFNITGSVMPDELKVKVYTIAGRLIKEIDIPPSSLKFGFNNYHWDGRDEDGDLIANGVYFYRVIYKNGTEVITDIYKMAKLK